MSDSLNDAPLTRWATLSQDVQTMERALNGFPLLGVLDSENNHISSMQEEIDSKIREALAVYWLSEEQDQVG